MSTELLTIGGHAVTPLVLLALGTGALMVGLALRLLLDDEPVQDSLFFGLFCLAVAMWLVGSAWMYGAPSEARALRWLRFSYVGVPLIPATLYTVTVHSLNLAEERRVALGALWSAAATFVLLTVATDVVVADLYRYDWGYYPRYTPAGSLFVAYVLAGIGSSLVEYALRYRNARSGPRRRRSLRFLLAFGVGSLAVTDFLPAYGVDVYPLGQTCVAVMAVFIGRTIRRYHLTELTPAFAADQILAAMNDAVLVVDRKRRIRAANSAAEGILGHRPEDLRGRRLDRVARPGGDDADDAGTWPEVLDGSEVRARETVLASDAGVPVETSVSAAPLLDHERRVGTAVVLRDLREREALRQKAFHDALTGLPNRALYRDRLDQLLRRQPRRPGRDVAVLYLDLDGFKEINDGLGHWAGNRVLEQVADRLRGVTRDGDTAARLGGDEFAVVLSDLDAATATAEARAVARRAREALAEPVELEEASLRVSAAIGIAVAAGEAVGPEELTRRADRAMYRSKAGPVGAIHVFREAWEEDVAS